MLKLKKYTYVYAYKTNNIYLEHNRPGPPGPPGVSF